MLMDQNRMMHCSMRSQRTTITMTATTGDCKPKKAYDQSTLTRSWAANTPKAILPFMLLIPVRQIKKRDRPMRVKIAIQTAEMIDPCGVNQGLTRVGYQLVTELAVNTEPMTPAIWHIAMHKMSQASSLIVIEVISHTFFCAANF